MQDNQIPTKMPVAWATSAPGGDVTNPVPIPSQISITPGRASFTDGFVPDNFQPQSAGGVPPFGQDFNGIFQMITQWLRWFTAGAPVSYDATFQTGIGGYPNGSIVASATSPPTRWLSTADNNLSDPDTGGANWVFYGGTATVSVTGSSTTYTQAQGGSNVVRSNGSTVPPTPMADTLPGTSPGVLANQTAVTVTNGDTTATMAVKAGAGASIKGAAYLAPNGYLYLGPGQSATFVSDGSNYWLVQSPGRCRLPAQGVTMYMATTGNDGNHGLTSAAPLATLQNAYNYVQDFFDLAGYQVTIQLANGDYINNTLQAEGKLVGQSYVIQCQIVGNNGSPSSVQLTDNLGNFLLIADDGAQFGFGGISFVGAAGLVASQRAGSIILVNANNIFGAAPGAGQLNMFSGGEIIINGDYSIAGSGAGAHYACLDGGRLEVLGNFTATLLASPTYSVAFVSMSTGIIDAEGITFAGSSSNGGRYNIERNAVLIPGGGGNFFPGTSPGVASTGAQYG